MVVPEQLAEQAYVPDAVKCKILNLESLWLEEYLGQSELRLAKAGVEFYFTERIAKELEIKEVVEIIK